MLLSIIKGFLRLLPADTAAVIATALASFPRCPPLKKRDQSNLGEFQRFEFGQKTRKYAWRTGQGPLVIFVHGWSGRASQMAPMAKYIADCGYCTVIFDATAHGESSGKTIGFHKFMHDVAELSAVFSHDVFAYVGHSAGGLSVMAARSVHGIKAERYVCLAAPRAPYPPIAALKQQLGVSGQILNRCQQYYAQQFSSSWESLDKASSFSYRNQGALLLVYDEQDDQVDHLDGDRISQTWPAAQVIKTTGLGHRKVLWSPVLFSKIAGFLSHA